MTFELNTENKRLERLFKDYTETFVKKELALSKITYHYEIFPTTGIGQIICIVCDQTKDRGDITDYSEW